MFLDCDKLSLKPVLIGFHPPPEIKFSAVLKTSIDWFPPIRKHFSVFVHFKFISVFFKCRSRQFLKPELVSIHPLYFHLNYAWPYLYLPPTDPSPWYFFYGLLFLFYPKRSIFVFYFSPLRSPWNRFQACHVLFKNLKFKFI